LAYHYRRKSIGSSSSMSSRAGRANAMALMRRRTASGKPRERGGCAAPAREGGFFAGFVVFDISFERAAACFTGEGRGCGENSSQLLCVLETILKETHLVHPYLGPFPSRSAHLLVLFPATAIQHVPKKSPHLSTKKICRERGGWRG
jgi:hypothetical protein